MRKYLAIFLLTCIGVLAACDGGIPPTQIVLEVPVTVEVTRIVTSVPEAAVASSQNSVDGPIPFDTASPAPTSATTAVPTITPTPNLLPEPEVGQVFVAEQRFQNGRMFWVRPINQIWVLIEPDETSSAESTAEATADPDSEEETISQEWQIFEDTFQEGMPEFDPSLIPPDDGFIQPIRGFGLLWRESPGLREELGWAIETEVGYYANYEYHYGGSIEDGAFVQGPGYHLIETPERRVFRLNEGIWNWEVIEPET